MFRYLLVYSFNLLLNYALLKLAVEVLHIYPTFAQIGTTFVAIASYLAQRHFSFRKKPCLIMWKTRKMKSKDSA